jgi:hypothetical protein
MSTEPFSIWSLKADHVFPCDGFPFASRTQNTCSVVAGDDADAYLVDGKAPELLPVFPAVSPLTLRIEGLVQNHITLQLDALLVLDPDEEEHLLEPVFRCGESILLFQESAVRLTNENRL